MMAISRPQRAFRPKGRRALAAALVAVSALAASGCRPHRAPLAYVCTVNGKPVTIVAGRRGTVALAKIGLTPAVLKSLQTCKVK